MDTIELEIGTIHNHDRGNIDNRQPVTFIGELIAEITEHEGRNDRGITHELYRTEDNRLILHQIDWSRWRGEHSTYRLEEVRWQDFQIGGDREPLGAKLDIWEDSLSLDQALERQGTALPKESESEQESEFDFKLIVKDSHHVGICVGDNCKVIQISEILYPLADTLGAYWLSALNRVHRLLSADWGARAKNQNLEEIERTKAAKQENLFGTLLEELQDLTEQWENETYKDEF